MKKIEKKILRRSFIRCTPDKRNFWVEPYSGEINLGSILNANWQLKYILESKDYASGWLLDIGCGKKPYLYVFDNVEEYVGIEWSKSLHLNKEIDILADATQLPVKNESFDTVLCTEVIEHVYDFRKVIREMNRVLKRNGVLMLSTVFFYWVNEPPFDFFRFTKDGLSLLMEENGFEIEHLWNRGGVFSVIGDIYGKVINRKIERGFGRLKRFRTLSWIRLFLLWSLVVIPQRLYVKFTFVFHSRCPNIVGKLNMEDNFTLGYFLIARKIET